MKKKRFIAVLALLVAVISATSWAQENAVVGYRGIWAFDPDSNSFDSVGVLDRELFPVGFVAETDEAFYGVARINPFVLPWKPTDRRDGVLWSVDKQTQEVSELYEFPPLGRSTIYGATVHGSKVFGTTATMAAEHYGLLWQYDIQSNEFEVLHEFDDFPSPYIAVDEESIIGSVQRDGARWSYDRNIGEFRPSTFDIPDSTTVRHADNGTLYALGRSRLWALSDETNEFEVIQPINWDQSLQMADNLVAEGNRLFGITGGDNLERLLFSIDTQNGEFVELYDFGAERPLSVDYVDGLLYGTATTDDLHFFDSFDIKQSMSVWSYDLDAGQFKSQSIQTVPEPTAGLVGFVLLLLPRLNGHAIFRRIPSPNV